MDSQRSIGTFSKYAQYVPVVDPSRDERGFVDALKAFASSLDGRPVVFPTNDNWASALAKNKDELSESCILCVADKDVVELVLNKDRFSSHGKANNYLTPLSWQADEIDTVPDDMFPVLVKPKKRRDSSSGMDASVAKTMDSMRFQLFRKKYDLQEFLQSIPQYREFLQVEQYVNGLSDTMFTVGVYADHNSEIRGVFSGRKVRGYPAEYGDCIVGEVHSVPASVRENTSRIVREIKYTGIAEFEYKRDSLSGEWFLIEINPRSWSWIGITDACDVSLPWIAYCDLTGAEYNGKTTSHSVADGTVKYVKILQDRWNCLYGYRKTYPPWAMTRKEWKRSLSSERIVFAEFNASDWPVAVIALLRRIRRRLLRALSCCHFCIICRKGIIQFYGR